MRTQMIQTWNLAIAQLHSQYLGTRLGFLWALIQPALTFLIFWVVSVYGLKMGGSGGGPPYFAVLFCGLLPWMSLSTGISSASGGLQAHKHLLVDRVASSMVIVVSNALAATLMHAVLAAIVALIFIAAGVEPSVSWLKFPYYYLCLSALCLASCSIVAPFSARGPDFTQIVTTVLLVWFWASPIVWAPSIIPQDVIFYFRLNPLFYVIEGYRDTFLDGVAPPAGMVDHLMFWIVTSAILALGVRSLRTSEPHLREWLQR